MRKNSKNSELKFMKLDYIEKDKDGNEIKHQSQGVLPTRATAGSAGLDLYSTRITNNVDGSGRLVLTYHTDIAVEIPEGYFGLIVPKSSIWERSLVQTNGAGVLDHDYRGELQVKFKIITDAIPTIYQRGEAFAQLVVLPCAILEPTLVDQLSETERGTKGFGEADKANQDAKTR